MKEGFVVVIEMDKDIVRILGPYNYQNDAEQVITELKYLVPVDDPRFTWNVIALTDWQPSWMEVPV